MSLHVNWERVRNWAARVRTASHVRCSRSLHHSGPLVPMRSEKNSSIPVGSDRSFWLGALSQGVRNPEPESWAPDKRGMRWGYRPSSRPEARRTHVGSFLGSLHESSKHSAPKSQTTCHLNGPAPCKPEEKAPSPCKQPERTLEQRFADRTLHAARP